MPDSRASRFCAAFAEWAIIHLSETECNSFLLGGKIHSMHNDASETVGFNVMSTEALKRLSQLED